jgi:HEAT repeat protein
MSDEIHDPRRLVRRLRWSGRQETLDTLVNLGEAAIPALVEGLGNSDQDVENACITALARIGPASVAVLLEALHDPMPRIRSGAAKVLGHLGQDVPAAAGALMALLDSNDPHARVVALEGLARMGLNTDVFAARVIEMLSDEAGFVRAGAIRVLEARGTPPREAIMPLLRVVANNEHPVTEEALRALDRVGAPVIPVAIDALASQDAAVRRAAAQSLTTLGRASAPAVPALVAHLQNDDANDVRKWCARALREIPAPPEIVVPVLIDRVRRDRSLNVKREAILGLGSLGPAAKSAAPALVESLRRDWSDSADRDFQRAIATAIRALGREAIERLVDALGDPDPLGRQALGEALAWVGWSAVSVLLDRLRSGQAGDLPIALQDLAPRSAGQFLSEAAEAEAELVDWTRHLNARPQVQHRLWSSADHLLREMWSRVDVPEVTRQAAITAEPLAFTVYYPTEVRPEIWYTLLAYAHLQNCSGLVEDDARGHLDIAVQSRRSRAKARHEVWRHAAIVVVPELPGWEVNPRSVTLIWEEDWHRVEFRIRAGLADSGIGIERATNGRVAFYVESLLVGEVPVSVFVSADAQTFVPARARKEERATRYDSVFVSYARTDSAVVDAISSALAAIGMQLLRDQQVLRSGEEWDRRLLDLIDKASIFQLYWSDAARQSPNVEREWRHALSGGRRPEGFIRPIYWVEPMPPPPPELVKLHFAYYPLASHAGRPT